MTSKNKQTLRKLQRLLNFFGIAYEINDLGGKFKEWYFLKYPNDEDLLLLSEALSVFLDEWGFSLINFIFCMCKR